MELRPSYQKRSFALANLGISPDTVGASRRGSMIGTVGNDAAASRSLFCGFISYKAKGKVLAPRGFAALLHPVKRVWFTYIETAKCRGRQRQSRSSAAKAGCGSAVVVSNRTDGTPFADLRDYAFQ